MENFILSIFRFKDGMKSWENVNIQRNQASEESSRFL